jgi:hypothetical protein
MSQREYKVVEVVETWSDGNLVGRFNIHELAVHGKRLHEQREIAEEQAKDQSRRICEALGELRPLIGPPSKVAEHPDSIVKRVIAILEGSRSAAPQEI